ncbi:3-hydroxyisobutyrate dehydrogenase-like beta-hydroxyacid dehydrogenase [Methylobacterium brachiatum]|uniref:3-hydroxyisobutyrate dehydrogenase-like beta-hydroxyacid dehydrogenase n=1 Tax=Methylobacterium brachiatum TaxID=269660 RepID=A0AAJ1TRA9_9HYPH|nr:NAD(P)-dependent oxidoreductase [Methylobacterium brachiatum]MCB4802605.1 NAD(P)-dependent oxidoreductase [Methylobacterium brachiatum]MDQ0543231.1 3-hydroxyisobutyrate dehydrogenase-like beta-hydroxyacid dehydrogenase [Methylobacterium brachiatum]
MQKLAILGLGAMGRPIARNLAAKHVDSETLVAMDADPARLDGLDGPGLVATADPAALDGAEVLFLCLPNGDVVEAALFGGDRLAERLAPGAIVVDLSTVAHAKALAIGGALAATGRRFVDAPVSGAPAGAEAGTLTVMCGGDAETVAAVRPLLERIGTSVLHMGPVGSGQLTKTINNVLYDINIAALAEVLPMAVAMGLDPDQVAQVVTTGTSRSYASQYFVPRILQGRFDEGYPMGAAYKDLVAAAAIAAEHGFPMPVTAAATATYQTALRQGHGDRDKGAMVLPFEGLLGVKVRSGG